MNITRLKKDLGKRRMAMVEDFDYYGTFDILMKDGWVYDGDSQMIILEPYHDETYSDILSVLKSRFDEFVWEGANSRAIGQ
tara:strand:- start:42 stop:284 length:243 start_codon:yes stop_codon:yes gene_type:complete